MKRRLLILFLLVTSIISAEGLSSITVSPSSWQIGDIRTGEQQGTEITLHNRSDEMIEVDILSTDSLLHIEARELGLAPDETATVNMIYTAGPSEPIGKHTKYLVIRTGEERELFPVTLDHIGIIPTDPNGSTDTSSGQPAGITAVYYYMPSCSTCLDFLLSTASEYVSGGLQIEEVDVKLAEGFERMEAHLEGLGVTASEFPILIIGDAVFQGEPEVERGRVEAEALISQGLSLESLTGTAAEEEIGAIGIGTIFLSGLLDGINPCVFSTLIFLLSMLAMLGKSRRDILIIGIWYSSAVFVTYYLVGIGLSYISLFISRFSFMSIVLDYLLVGVLAVLAVISLYDFYLSRQGKSSQMLLQLSHKDKKRIHRVIRGKTRSRSLSVSAAIMGILVSLFELGCTGQIYVPTLLYMASVNPGGPAYWLLLLYNIGFILPLLAIFGICIAGVSSKRLESFFRKHVAAIKLMTAILFCFLIVLILS